MAPIDQDEATVDWRSEVTYRDDADAAPSAALLGQPDRKGIENDPRITPTSSEPRDKFIIGDHRSKSKFKERKLLSWTLILFCLQWVMLGLTIAFMVWTSLDQRVVPDPLATFFIENPQTFATVSTLAGSILSLINTRLFSESIRIILNAFLRHPRGIGLYSFYSAVSVASKALLYTSARRRLHWMAISIFYFVIFTLQTSAWTTLLTPKMDLVPFSTYVTEIGLGNISDSAALPLDGWIQADSTSQYLSLAEMSGIAAPQTYAFPPGGVLFNGSVFNGPTSGILPLTIGSDYSQMIYSQNSKGIIVQQEGFTGDVSCKEAGSGSFTKNYQTINLFNQTYLQVSANCNCINSTCISQPVLARVDGHYFTNISDAMNRTVSFAACSYDNATTDRITLYVDGIWSNSTPTVCKIRPRLTSVMVSYKPAGSWIAINTVPSDDAETLADDGVNIADYDGTYIDGYDVVNVTVDGIDVTYSLDGVPLTSPIVKNAMTVLSHIFSTAQSLALNGFSPEILPPNYSGQRSSAQLAFIEAYIRGIFEGSGTVARMILNGTIQQDSSSGSSTDPVTQPKLTWGPTYTTKVFILIAPMVIMVTTIALLAFSFYQNQLSNAKPTDFDGRNPLHVIAACRAGNVEYLTFPDDRNNSRSIVTR